MTEEKFYHITRTVTEEWFAANSWTTVQCPHCNTQTLNVIVATSAVVECGNCKALIIVDHRAG